VGARVEDITIRDAPTWTTHFVGCENLVIAGVTIRNDFEVPNCDGMGIDHCRHVRIANCDIAAGDDCIVIRASRMFAEYGPCEDVAVSNCVLSSWSAAIRIDPEGPSAMRRVAFTGCTIANSNRGICISVRDGGTVEDMVFSDMTVTTELKEAHWWGAAEPVHVSNVPRAADVPPGIVRNLQFNNLICAGENGIFVHGWPGSLVERTTFDNVQVTVAKTSTRTGGFYDMRPGDIAGGIYQHQIAGVYCEHARHLALRGVSVDWRGALPDYYGPALEAHHIDHLQVSDFDGVGAHPGRDPDRIMDSVT
jgi:polygalacturonase